MYYCIITYTILLQTIGNETAVVVALLLVLDSTKVVRHWTGMAFEERLQQTRREKKWSEAFQDRIDSHVQEREDRKQKSIGKLTQSIRAGMLGRKFVAKCRARVNENVKAKRNTIPVKKTLENLKPPSRLNEWEYHMNSSSICDICFKQAITDIKFCKYCDSVCHIHCVDAPEHAPGECGFDSDESGEYFTCSECIDTERTDAERFEAVRDRLREERFFQFYRNLIGKTILSFWIKRKYVKKRQSAIKIQTFYRK